MTAFLIVYGTDPADRLAAYRFNDRTAALAAANPKYHLVPGVPPGNHAGGCSYIIEREEDVTFSPALLVAVFNGLTESGVKRFESRQAGVKRLLSVLPEIANKEVEMSDVDTAQTGDSVVVKGKGKTKKTDKSKRPAVTEGHATKKEWRKPRDGTMRAKVIRAMHGKSRSVAEIAKGAGIPEDRVLPHIYATWRDCGIGYKVDGENYALDLPEGTHLGNLFQEVEPKAEKKQATKTA